MIHDLKPSAVNTFPETPGVYRFKDDRGVILYIGKAINLRRRVSSYFQKTDHDAKTAQMVPQITRIEITGVDSEFEALLLEAALIRKHVPKYNIIWKDDKQYIYIKITNEEFPRILFSRKEEEPKGRTSRRILDAMYFGPFSSKRTVKDVLSYLRSIFPYCTQNRESNRPCFYTHIGLCYPCPSDIRRMKGETARQAKLRYRRNIRRIRTLLSGQIDAVKKSLLKDMQGASAHQQFEESARIRDRLQTLELLLRTYHAPEEYIKNPELVQTIREKEEQALRAYLKPYMGELPPLTRIECYDVSNISGTLATGSMVTFIGGDPAKDYYRRFRIRTKTTPDDFAMLREMLRRRLKHTEWNLPDLFIIDGGKPQLLAIGRVMKECSIGLPVIGLAKHFEEIVIPKGGTFTKIQPRVDSPAIHLLQRIRDEAHRFAHKYHEHLRLKELYA